MKPFLILQLRPEVEAADEEFTAFLRRGRLDRGQVHRIRLDQEPLPVDLSLDDYAGVIVGGGPGCVSDPPEARNPTEARIEAAILSLMPEITARDFPFMGCCYGIGILGHHLGAPVTKALYGEPVSPTTATRTPQGAADPLLADLPDRFDILVGHKEALDDLPEGCVHLLEGPRCPFQMIRHGQNVYATQFHPEADGQSFALRIRIYRDKGYFPPDQAEALTAACRDVMTEASGRILANFTARYGA
ncbi:glutamine amidotransferase [Rhodobacteraceae bacterium 2376]|uniref:Glutamine amidotransferase n=1 Tax=Rhabdonatronobacter sediminivivens TaxID=2743469 RepID=A0A7Z0I0B5_9RHOB|nr:glutamine amidotransferase [Rhabdonatronobacter sediminivivens]NYS25563.1 glutamine amidotransferase [Rhabdonatronobacter sediminivivens]